MQRSAGRPRSEEVEGIGEQVFKGAMKMREKAKEVYLLLVFMANSHRS